MHKILLGLGSNKGDRILYIKSAIDKLSQQLGKVVIKASIYETAAWGKTDQDAFLNTAVLVNSPYSPLMCFKIIKQIEKQLERISTEHWGPREIDIDILLFDKKIMQSEQLTIPHVQMHKRNFVMAPSAQITPNWRHPILQKSLKQIYKECEDELPVTLWKS